jgi:hypothetical protein
VKTREIRLWSIVALPSFEKRIAALKEWFETEESDTNGQVSPLSETAAQGFLMKRFC